MTARFTISLPPSLNNIFRNMAQGGRAKTADYKGWLTAAAWEIKAQRPTPIAGDVAVDLVIERPNAASDLDNRIKPVLDACQTAGVIENDKRVVDLRARWGAVRGCEVKIHPASAGAAA